MLDERCLSSAPKQPSYLSYVDPRTPRPRGACVTVREYREMEAGTRWPGFETYGRICKLFGWPQAFVK
jgi:hypothetical protein